MLKTLRNCVALRLSVACDKATAEGAIFHLERLIRADERIKTTAWVAEQLEADDDMHRAEFVRLLALRPRDEEPEEPNE
jgi:hypothetical protein